MEAWLLSVLTWFALPQVGLSTVFIVSLVSATLLPIGSEFAVLALVKLDPPLFWPAVLVATVGNTIGGAISWWMGYGAERAYERLKHQKPHEARALQWLQRFGAKACLLSWLPAVGDPLCAVAYSVLDNARNAYGVFMEGGPHVIWGRGFACPDSIVEALLYDGTLPAAREQRCSQDFIMDYLRYFLGRHR